MGGKQVHMWWDEFERELMEYFETYDINYGRKFHLDAIRLCIILKNIPYEFL